MIEKEVEYSKEIDSNSSFSVFQSAWMSACLKVERHKYILLELRLPLCKAAGVLETHPLGFAPGEIRIQAFSQAARGKLWAAQPWGRGLPSEPEFS